MRTTEQLAKIFGAEAAASVPQARLLVVGAGGIGCELLKNLSMSGFRHIEAVDLDTIDLSNLNRQFLFQRKHIRRAKAEVAIQAIRGFNPDIEAKARQANIKDSEFGVDWFSQFDLVLNALDNLEARRHVNTMCLAANVPLIESGTAGYLGQVTVIKGGTTECFECHPKPAERKTFPICTIRSTPSAPIHCIVWAKNYLFAQLFGGASSEDEEIVDDLSEENMEELKQLREESRALSKLADAMGSPGFARAVFEKAFTDDINRLLSVPEMWRCRQPPTPLDYAELDAAVSGIDRALPDSHAIMSAAAAFALFVDAAVRLAQRRGDGSISFDKDDEDALHFVAATASLRSHVFGIEQRSIFATKAMAGNIIPAIATTNAVVAGMMVTQAVMVVSKQLAKCHTAYVSYSSKRARSILREPLAEPNPRCTVCRRRYLTLRVADLARTTLGDVVDYLHMLAETEHNLDLSSDLSIVEGSRIIYDMDFEDNMDKSLESLGLVAGKMICVTSEDDGGEDAQLGSAVPVMLSIAEARVQQGGEAVAIDIEGFENIPVFAPLPPAFAASPADEADELEPVNDSLLQLAEDGVIVVSDDHDGVDAISEELAKRKLGDIIEEDGNSSKRRAVAETETGANGNDNSDDVVAVV